MKRKIIGVITGVLSLVGTTIAISVKKVMDEREDVAAHEERIINIENTIATLHEEGMGNEKIIDILKKIYDLRHSEAKEFLQRYREDEQQILVANHHKD